jgi:tetratricopeptide (TPR) repeat protein
MYATPVMEHLFRRGVSLGLLAAGALVLLAAMPSSAVEDAAVAAGAPDKLGVVNFSESCDPAVAADFDRGVALLHDFWYEEARPQFERIIARDPRCAMAHWGLALSGFHQIWDRPDAAVMATGRREMQAAAANPPKTARERAYIAALTDFFRPGPAEYQSRIDAYATAMQHLHEEYPDDVDAAAFYALALLASEAPDDTSLAHERQALAVLKPLWARFPDHPGLVHYIIHACDNPTLAAEGLSAARHYGEIAPSGPHAVHMPGHIFARLGLWQEDIDANNASVAASRAAEARHESGWMDQFHSDDFLIYAYLQRGDDAHARAVLEDANTAITHYESMPDMASPGHFMAGMFPYYRVKMPLFIALETRDWESAAKLEPIAKAPPETQLQVYWARVMAAGHRHRGADARRDAAAWTSLMSAVRKGDHAFIAESTGAQIRRDEVTGWRAFAEGHLPEALRRLRAAADLEDKVGQGEVDIPAREMLGDMLLEAHRPAEALTALRRSLELSPNRFNTLYLAGRAAEAAGEPDAARGYYVTLLRSVVADSPRAELQHARTFTGAAVLGDSSRSNRPGSR